MEPARFALALERIEPTEGALFEQLAAEFAVIEYSNLRTVASLTGDGGRDAYLHATDDELTVLQYSVAADWRAKILATIRRLQQTFPKVRELVYVTNQQIGANGDGLRKQIRQEKGVFLDIWDKSWFVERVNTHPQREIAAERLAKVKVDPLLSSVGILRNKAVALTSEEERCAAVYLALQLADEDRQKGWTRVCFETLVRAALRNSDSSHRMSRADIHAAVGRMIPSSDAMQRHVNSALSKLTKKTLRHWEKEDEFCLSHEEAQRLRNRLAQLESRDRALRKTLRSELEETCSGHEVEGSYEEFEAAIETMRLLVDQVLNHRGESFATALVTGEVRSSEGEQVWSFLDANVEVLLTSCSPEFRLAVTAATSHVLLSPDRATHDYLRAWSQSYTLFSLLKATPDVQATVVKLFSSGRIWIDANVILPVLAEELVEAERQQYTNLLLASRRAGIELFVTRGIVEELVAHMRRSSAYVYTCRQGRVWDGEIPFLFGAYALSGGSADSFNAWLANFRGTEQPIDDLAEYLGDRLGVELRDLAEEAERLDVALRGAAIEIWLEARERSGRNFDAGKMRLLADHDVECYLGVVGLRRRETQSGIGFSSWWLTLDGTAYRARKELRARVGGQVPASPVMSPDFLLDYLEVGPIRGRIQRDAARPLPIMIDISVIEGVPSDMVQTANQIRVENSSAPTRVVRRKIRDAMNMRRTKAGPLALGGAARMEAEVLAAIQDASSHRNGAAT